MRGRLICEVGLYASIYGSLSNYHSYKSIPTFCILVVPYGNEHVVEEPGAGGSQRVTERRVLLVRIENPQDHVLGFEDARRGACCRGDRSNLHAVQIFQQDLLIAGHLFNLIVVAVEGKRNKVCVT